MAHRRKEIRDKIRALLLNNTSAGANVFTNRSAALFTSQLPAIAIYTGDEDSEFLNPPENRLKRTLQVFIEFAKLEVTEGAIEDEIDALCLEIENIIKPKNELDRLYGNIVQSVILKKSEFGTFEKNSDILGTAKLSYDFEYDSDY